MKKSIYISLLVIICLVVGVSVYNRPASLSETKPLKIGLITIATGQYAAAGENYARGVELALDEYKTAHPDKKIELVIEDDGFDPAKGLSAYKKLTTLDHIDALINASTPTIGSVYEIAKSDHMPVMQGGVQVTAATPDNVFQVSPDGNKALTAYAKYISSNYQFKNIAVVRDNTDYHAGFFNGFKAGLPQGYSVTEYINNGNDVKTLATKIANAKHDAIVIMMNPDSGALLSKELLIQNILPSILFYDVQLNTGLSEYQKILGGSIAKLDGAQVLTLKEGDSTSFNTRYKAKFNVDPGFFSEYGYDAFVTLINTRASSKDEWIKNIQTTNISGASSAVTFDENGVRKNPTEVDIVKDGKITMLKDEIQP